MKNACITLFLVYLTLLSCSKTLSVGDVLELAGDNRSELEKVLHHYDSIGDKRKIAAAKFLIANMGYNKFSYDGEIIPHYDRIIQIYDSLRKSGTLAGEPPAIMQAWDSITKRFGQIQVRNLEKRLDYKTLKASLLIRNIDWAFQAWEKSPLYNPDDFDLFCEYILPHRMQNEPVEDFREKYYRELKIIADTASSVHNIIRGYNSELRWNRQYRESKLLWDYPLELPLSKMEFGRRGACRQLSTFQALVMRAAGLPVTIDRAIWANRSQGHSWNVLILGENKMFPFDALSGDSIKFSYKPAKIFRKTYSYDIKPFNKIRQGDIPVSFFTFDEKDVTDEYVKAYDVVIPIHYMPEQYKQKKQGVVCVFDNEYWRPVYWGNIKNKKFHFNKMASDVLYLGAFFENSRVVPATEPFLLQADGNIRFFRPDMSKRITLHLERKFPRFKRIEDHAWGLRRTNAEASNNPRFKDATLFFSIYNIPFDMADSLVNSPGMFRYVRFNSSTLRNANYAEVEFYGSRSPGLPEEKLSGKIIGYPPPRKDDEHPYTHAMDGNIETWFEKLRDSVGWIGLDLGKKHCITRIRFCPRSDTNFIIQGDSYELLYWNRQGWKSVERKSAEQYNHIDFTKVPSGTMYLLRNHSRGKEERVFTYEKGKQVWW